MWCSIFVPTPVTFSHWVAPELVVSFIWIRVSPTQWVIACTRWSPAKVAASLPGSGGAESISALQIRANGHGVPFCARGLAEPNGGDLYATGSRLRGRCALARQAACTTRCAVRRPSVPLSQLPTCHVAAGPSWAGCCFTCRNLATMP